MKRTALLLILCTGFVIAAFAKRPDPPAPAEVRTRLSQNVTYSSSYIKKGRWTVHTVVADLLDPTLSLRLGKGLENIAGLERVQNILHRFDSLHHGFATALAGVNANFWRAGSNHPMGPTVSEGVILRTDQYKNWSSVAVTTTGSVHIDRFSVTAGIRTRFGLIPIEHFNYRHDSLSLSAYTSYFGSTVPFLDTSGIFLASQDTITDDSESDSVVTATVDSVYSRSPESGTLKIQFRYLRAPLANTLTPCRITAIDTSIMAIPVDGGVLSFGRGRFPLFFSLFVGDTFSLESRVSPVLPDPVRVMTGGTPRIVRDGKVSVEWQEEGLRKRRFVTGRYARTAFGVSKNGSQIIMVTVEGSSRRARRQGIGLADLAKVLIDRGAWQALNFDGGGSATMVVSDQTVAPATGTRYSRKISTTLFLVETKHGKPGHTGTSPGVR